MMKRKTPLIQVPTMAPPLWKAGTASTTVLVAFAVGGIELMQVIASEVGLTSGFWGWLGDLDFETMGYAIIAIFLVSWLVAMAYYRYKGYEKTPLPRNVPLSGGTPSVGVSEKNA